MEEMAKGIHISFSVLADFLIRSLLIPMKMFQTWQDLRSSVKAKTSTIKNHVKRTGGGPPPTEVLTDTDKNILALLNPTIIDGDTTIEESTAKLVSLPWDTSKL